MKKAESQAEAVDRLVDIIKVLRVECPWDREQTHESLKTGMIEEAYEVCDAIDKNDKDNLREELGDVLLQVVFHGRLAEETEDFTLTDVINEECEKMIRRHPHVFLDENTKTVDKVLEKWENIKRKEHRYENYTDELNKVPKNLPALMRSYKVQKKASGVGFDWKDIKGADLKLHEELREFSEACLGGDENHIFEELGDLLFSVVNVSRFLKLNPELALAAATEKFIARFAGVEQKAVAKGLDLKEMSLEEMDKLWDEVKRDNMQDDRD